HFYVLANYSIALIKVSTRILSFFEFLNS
ncbi:hypothetical protein EVA_22348, partial [gut metagenome]